MPDCPTPVAESDEYVCRDCRMRWDRSEDRPDCPKSFPRGGKIVPGSITILTPPAITADDVRRRREARGIGMGEAKRELEQEHLLATIQMWDLHRDPKVLTEILLKLAGKIR